MPALCRGHAVADNVEWMAHSGAHAQPHWHCRGTLLSRLQNGERQNRALRCLPDRMEIHRCSPADRIRTGPPPVLSGWFPHHRTPNDGTRKGQHGSCSLRCRTYGAQLSGRTRSRADPAAPAACQVWKKMRQGSTWQLGCGYTVETTGTIGDVTCYQRAAIVLHVALTDTFIDCILSDSFIRGSHNDAICWRKYLEYLSRCRYCLLYF